MNKKLNLIKILKDCPKGTKLYSPIFGEVEFLGIKEDSPFPIKIKCKSFKDSFREDFYRKNGSYCYPRECLLFPSKDQRDWSKFKFKKPKFDPKTLKPFDKVLTKHIGCIWRCDLFSHYREKNGRIESYCTNEGYIYSYCIPYNNETKHLVGTTEEAPEYYRYWEEGMTSDSKKKSYKCENELCEISTSICNKLKTIKNSIGYNIRFYPDKITEINSEKTAILNHLKKMWENCQDDVCGVHVEDAIAWLEKQGEQASLQTNERTWLYLVSDVLTWKDGIGQYLDDPRVQELAKKLCSKYAQKLYNPSNTGKDEQKSADKIEPRFKVGD